MRQNNYLFGASELRIVDSRSVTKPTGKVHRPSYVWSVPEDIERGLWASNPSGVRRDGPSAVTVARRVHAELAKIARAGRASAFVAGGPRLVKR